MLRVTGRGAPPRGGTWSGSWFVAFPLGRHLVDLGAKRPVQRERPLQALQRLPVLALLAAQSGEVRRTIASPLSSLAAWCRARARR